MNSDYEVSKKAGFKESKLVGIKRVDPQETYDLTIQDSHSFVANDIVVHNTIPKHTSWAKPLRKAYNAPEGMVILSCDYSAGEMRVAADFANEENMLNAFNTGVDIHCATAAGLMGMNLADFMLLKDADPKAFKSGRQGAKAGNFGCLLGLSYCITDKGSVQLRNIKKDHKVWDGENFVSHDGVIYQGEQWVIKYQGLEATPCHNVWVEDGTHEGKKCSLYEAATKKLNLRRTSPKIERKGLRHYNPRPKYSTKGKTAQNGGRYLLRLRRDKDLLCFKHNKRNDHHLPLPEECKVPQSGTRKGIRESLRFYGTAVRKRYPCLLPQIQRAGNKMPVQVKRRLCILGTRESLQGRLQRVGVRQDRQRWALRARKFKAGILEREQTKPAQQCVPNIQGGSDVLAGFQKSLQSEKNPSVCEQGDVGGGYYPPCKDISPEKVQELEAHGITLRKARVYDILNAGVNHRFTCSGVLVSNCLYGMSAGGYQAYAEATYGVIMTMQEAEVARERFFGMYPALPEWHTRTKNFARANGYVRSPLGRLRHLPLITARDGAIRSKAERNAVNSSVQGTLSDLTQLSLVILRETYGFKDLQPLMMVHDDLKFYVPKDDALMWADRVCNVMSTLPLKEEFDWSPRITFNADPEVGLTLASMEELETCPNCGERNLVHRAVGEDYCLRDYYTGDKHTCAQ